MRRLSAIACRQSRGDFAGGPHSCCGPVRCRALPHSRTATPWHQAETTRLRAERFGGLRSATARCRAAVHPVRHRFSRHWEYLQTVGLPSGLAIKGRMEHRGGSGSAGSNKPLGPKFLWRTGTTTRCGAVRISVRDRVHATSRVSSMRMFCRRKTGTTQLRGC